MTMNERKTATGNSGLALVFLKKKNQTSSFKPLWASLKNDATE
jgi:hypothetical protein